MRDPVARDEAVREGLHAAARWSQRVRETTEAQRAALLGAIERLSTGLQASARLLESTQTDAEFESLRVEHERLSEENRSIAKAAAELEDHTTRLASLFTAIFRLHATLDLPEVLRAIGEVVLNLIGAESFVVWLADESSGGWVEASRDADLVAGSAPRPELEWPLERAALVEMRSLLPGEPPPKGAPIAVTPFVFQGACVGVLSIRGLLSHKEAFSDLDRELFDLLGEQAALAIVSAKTYSAVDRKLRTAKKLMSLLG